MEHKKSRLLRMTLKGGEARVFLCDTTEMAQRARDIHHASNTCSAALGRMLAAASIMGAGLKSEGDRITATINGGGPAGPICAVAGPDGKVKVTIEHPEVELQLKPNGKLDVGGALGKDGQLTIMRSFGYGEPYVGRVNLVSGEIAEDFAMYYLESEQTPSICALGTLVGEEIISAGGILIQAMPGCSEELLDALEIRAELFGSISQLLQDMALEELAYACFRGLDPEVLEEIPLELKCDCSREYIERVLLSMGEDEIRDLIRTQNGCEVTCHFCRSHYAFTGEELEKLVEQGKED
ncbi:MAG: Hsp33 family molecular chaperone HslO [Clostridia bacterium]|nr:Hsp33 family molecular chaperone HslO [Clostridia bacterium]MBQ4608712.1 Hsp33 family molecular chaperone HslO [Clostridia bacterium]MBQ6859660.1 Hsp33 family molecular chaperone HslO [Clostridia bacterium]MBQ7052762.1 Hsp33 family molecular chaperone HslO [Clostridia bacterium]